MKQPVSRNSFDQHRGYVGVYLQEGAPFVDATWNEAIDVQSSLLRDAMVDSGLEGTAGIELRVDPHVEHNKLVHWVLRGGPGRFYCGNLPVRWPEDSFLMPIASHDAGQDNDDRARTSGREFGVYLHAWVDTEDALERPDLDDPGIGLERGTFRKVVRTCIALDEPDLPPPEPTNLLLTVQGTYSSDANALYRIEPIGLNRVEGTTTASLLWDSANGSVVAQVTETAEQAATTIELSNTAQFEIGQYVRFEGPGVRGHVYRITNFDGHTISIEGHDCHDLPVSLEDFQCTSLVECESGRIKLEILDDLGPNGVSAILRVGARVKGLPRNLKSAPTPRTWLVTAVDLPNSLAEFAIELKPGPHQDLVLTAAKGDMVGIGIGSIVCDLPKPYFQGAWQVVELVEHGENVVLTATPCGTVSTRVMLAPNGLVDALNPWYDERATQLKLGARSFDVCIEVENRRDWCEGMRIRIHADSPEPPCERPEFLETECCHECKPGDDRVRSFEDRTIAKIIHHGDACHSMTIRLDQPLSFDHGKHSRVVPMRLIKARRFVGHICSIEIDRLDPRVCPNRTEHYGPYSLEGGIELESGLMIRISVEGNRERRAVEPHFVPGDAWTFAARFGGWVESRVFAPVERVPRGMVQLAQCSTHTSPRVVDTRPLPVSHTHKPWLDTLCASIEELAPYVVPDPAKLCKHFAALAGFNRAQVGLIEALEELGKLYEKSPVNHPRCRSALDGMVRVLIAAKHNAGPLENLSSTDLARIAVALQRLAALTVLLEHPDSGGGASERSEPNAPQQASGDTPNAETPGAATARDAGQQRTELAKLSATNRGDRQPYALKLSTRFMFPLRSLGIRSLRSLLSNESLKQPPALRALTLSRAVPELLTLPSASGIETRQNSTELEPAAYAGVRWRSRVPTEQLRRAFSIQDVIAYYNKQSRFKEGR